MEREFIQASDPAAQQNPPRTPQSNFNGNAHIRTSQTCYDEEEHPNLLEVSKSRGLDMVISVLIRLQKAYRRSMAHGTIQKKRKLYCLCNELLD